MDGNSAFNNGFINGSDLFLDTDPGTKDQISDSSGVESEEDSNALIAEGVRIVLSAIAAWPVNENEDPFDGTLDSIKPPWEEDAELRNFLEMDSEPETPDEVETKQIEEFLSQSLQESKIKTEESEKLPEPPSNLTRSASCDELRDAKQLVDKLQEILDDPFESKERKLSQGQKLVRSLSDLLLVSAENESGEALKTPTVENQRSKSFIGLNNFLETPENRGGTLMVPVFQPSASSTPTSPSAIMQNTRRPPTPTPNRKFHLDGPVVVRSTKFSPSKQPQKKKEGPTTLIPPKRAGSSGRMSINKIKKNVPLE